jgi:hypothetical protein
VPKHFQKGSDSMSVISAFKEPQDILSKLLREGQRTWRAADPQEKCDHFFNYCVTAHALRDWCIKHLNLQRADVTNFHTEMNTIKYFGECRDIANSSKHFGLSSSVSAVAAATTTESDLAVLTGGNALADLPTIRRSDIAISLSDGTSIDLFGFLHHTSTGWINVLKNKSISVNANSRPEYMFIEYVLPP